MIDESKALITMAHVRKAGMCSKGARAFFIAHDLDWSEFLAKGVSIERVRETGDHMAMQVIHQALKDYNGKKE